MRPTRSRRAVLVIYPNFPPDATAGVFRVLRWAKYLPEFGWSPEFLVMNHELSPCARDPSLGAEVPPGTVVRRVASWAPEDRFDAFFKRGRFRQPATAEASSDPPSRRRWSPRSLFLGMFRPIWALLLRTPDPHIWWLVPAVRAGVATLRGQRCEAILTTGPPHSTHLVGVVLKRLTGRPLVCDFRDPWAVSSFGPEQNPWGRGLRGPFEAWVFRAADRVVLNTSRMAAFYGERYPRHRSKLSVVTNGFDPAYRSATAGNETFCGLHPRTLRLCHPGSLYGKRDPRPMLHALARLIDEGFDLCFEQIGMHDGRFDLPGFVRQLKLSGRVDLLPRMSHSKVLERLQNADIFLVLQPEAPLQVPSKAYEMMVFSKPLLALTGAGATADLMQTGHWGAVAPADDPEAIAEVLRSLAGQIFRGSAPRTEAASKELERFDGRNLAGTMATVLEGSGGG